eukprot:symbB.v1.2.023073.t1/scaffold2086.1/size90009/10
MAARKKEASGRSVRTESQPVSSARLPTLKTRSASQPAGIAAERNEKANDEIFGIMVKRQLQLRKDLVQLRPVALPRLDGKTGPNHQEQAAQLIASMVGLAWGSLLNICRTITAFLFESDDFRNEFGSIPVQWLHPSSLLVSRNTMPDIAKSDISPNLDRDKMFNELWWLNYCFCEGVGIGAVGNPFFGGEAVNICLHSKCEMTDIGDPFCSNIRVCLCLTDQCSLPPAPGSPICVCFNKKLAGDDGWSGQQLFDWSTSFGDTFWLYYIFCFGIGFSAPQANGRPLFAVQTKELCIKAGTKLATPMEGGKLCSSVSTRLCFWDQCAMPPAEGAPMFSCFNLLNSKGASAKPLAYGS